MLDDGAEHRVPFAQSWAVPLEQGLPVRRFTCRKGQRHLSELWWSTGGHVGFESWLERDQVLHLDFDPSVVGIASQPFWLHWTAGPGKRGLTCAGFLRPQKGWPGGGGRLQAGGAPRAAEHREVRGDGAGLRGGRVGVSAARCGGCARDREPAVVGRLPASRHHLPRTVEVLRRVFANPMPLMAGAEAARDPIAVLPVLFHLLWCHELTIDLSTPLREATLVSPSAGQRYADQGGGASAG